MATASVINSTLMRVYFGSPPVAIACALDASLDLQMATRDTTCKDSGAWQDFEASFKSGTISTSGLYKDASAPTDGGWIDIYDDWDARTTVWVRFSTNVTGDTYWEAQALITSLSLNSSGADENVTYSATFQIKGSITKATN